MTSIDGDACFELFADCPTTVGEGPLWDVKTNTLFWIDVFNGDVFHMPAGGGPKGYERFPLGVGKIGGMVFTKDGGLLLFADKGRVWSWRPGAPPALKAELEEAANSRFNDVIADPAGRVYCGVAPAAQGGEGSLWRFDPDASFSCVEPVTHGMPNGMGFSPDLERFYFTVTGERVIYRYDYDRATGAVTGRVPFVKVPETEGFPDGMTVDAEGCVWSAQWNGSRLVRYSASGEKLLEYSFPIMKISCVVFGRPDFSDLYVTTANHPFAEADYARVKAGAVFLLKRGGKGLPEFAV